MRPAGSQGECDPDLDENWPVPGSDDPEYAINIPPGEIATVVPAYEVAPASDIPSTTDATRTFHPKRNSRTAIEDILKQAIEDNSHLYDPAPS